MSDGNRYGLLDWPVAALLGGGALTLYVLTLAPGILAGDPGEFQFVPYVLGVAHPTGYPLYTLLGWAWSHLLPIGDVAYRMNLFSAFWAALAVAFLYPTACTLFRLALPILPPFTQRLTAALSAITFAVTPTLWSQAVIAEVYGLHIFFVVLLLFLLLTWAERQPRTSPTHVGETALARARSAAAQISSARAEGTEEGHLSFHTSSSPAGGIEAGHLLLLAACCFGFSLAHHSTTLLLAPAVLAFVWLTDRRVFRDRPLVLKALLLLLLPLVLYLYIPWRATHTGYLRLPLTPDRDLVLYENTPATFAHFVLGGPFSGSVDLSVDLGARLIMTGGLLRDEVGWIALFVALVGLIKLAIGRPGPPHSGSEEARSRHRRWALLALTGLTFGATVTFNLVYTIADIFVLYMPSYLVIVLWFAVGVGTLVALAGRQRVVGILLVVLFYALPLWLGVTHYAAIDQSQNNLARRRWEAILAEPLPSGAVLISNDRNDIMPMWYLQYVDRRRSDLLGLFPLITPDYPELGYVLDLALSIARPVYLIKEMPGVELKVEVEQGGQIWRILGPSVQGEPAHPRNASLADALVLLGYDRAPHSPRPGETLQVDLYWQAQRPLDAAYHSYVHLLDAEGQVIAQSDRQPGGDYYPATLWQPGERLRDSHRLTVPHDATVGVYRLLAGMYSLADDGTLEPLGEPLVIGQLGIKADVQTKAGDFRHPVGANFGGQIELLGFNTESDDGMLAVTLYWRCLQPPDADYTVFIHLVDVNGKIVAQHDGPPQNGAYPTSVWDPGEVVVDEHLLSLLPDLPSGDYRLQVGLYLPETGERLPVQGGGDSVELSPL